MILGGLKKRRVGSINRIASYTDLEFTKSEESLNLTEFQKLHHFLRSSPTNFNDPSTSDVILRLRLEYSSLESDSDDLERDEHVDLHLRSNALLRSKYFAALLSDRWKGDLGENSRVSLKVPCRSLEAHITVLQLLHTNDFTGTIVETSTALSILPVALKLLFDDCIKACIRFLEAVPWTEEEEKEVMNIIPFLNEEESFELLARVSPSKGDPSEGMLDGLIAASINSPQNVACVKAFVAKLLRDFSRRDLVRKVLDRAFRMSLKKVKESLDEYSSPDFRGDHDETEAIQRLNLHMAVVNGKHLLWLVERMIELRVADTAVNEWSDQESFTADLQRAFRDDAWRNIAPGLPTLVLRCTYRLANAVAMGSILTARQVRMKLVKDWLPVLIICRDNVSSISTSQKLLYKDLEETFLLIISTLPISDAQGLLQQCLSFSTRNVDDCLHLVSAFNTWFRRATRLPEDVN